MAEIKMKNSGGFSFTPVSNIFIDKYIAKAKAVFVCIYIYSLKKCMEGCSITIKETADEFDILETDVINAWKYWHEQKVVIFSETENDISIEFLEIGKSKIKTEKHFTVPSKPDYTPMELEIYQKQSSEAKGLFREAEKILGRMLTFNDMSAVYSFYDWLGMPMDVIAELLKYCAGNGNGRNMRYIETAALDWHERGIDNVEKAKDYIKTFNVDYREIMKAIGAGGSFPVSEQQKYMEKWLKNWKLPLEIIIEACGRAVMATDKNRFKYTDKILEDWYKAGVKNKADVEKLDADFLSKKNKPKKDKQPAVYDKPSKFVNYEQREWDFEKLNKLKSELLEKKLKG